MKHSVTSTPLAFYQLTDIWLRASDRQAVSNASDRIDILLRDDPEQFEMRNEEGWRVAIVSPLAVTFLLSSDDRKVTIVSVRYLP